MCVLDALLFTACHTICQSNEVAKYVLYYHAVFGIFSFLFRFECYENMLILSYNEISSYFFKIARHSS